MQALRVIRPWLGWGFLLVWIAVGGWAAWGYARSHPEDLPWTRLDLNRPVGLFTGRKLTALGRDPAQCRALLDRAGIRYTALEPRGEGACAVNTAIRFDEGGARNMELRPGDAGMACPVVATLTVWERQVVQPAARRHFSQEVWGVEHLGTASCRRIGGREDGAYSEHASANAIDIAAFVLADGRRITLAGDWRAPQAVDINGMIDPDAAFLREVRDGACDLFATVLSPDYNAAHRDHLHLDQAQRGAGWRACR